MTLLTFLSAVSLLPAIYPLRYILSKKDINLFDLVILFHTVNFAVSPLMNGHLVSWNENSIINTSLYYISFIFAVVLIDILWRKKRNDELHVINITKYIGQCKDIKINKIGTIVIIACLLYSLIFYMPRATYILHIEEEMGVEVDYQVKAMVIAWGNVWNILGIVLFLKAVVGIKQKKIGIIWLLMVVAYCIMNIFFPRRVFIFTILFLILCLYSIYRQVITKKLLVIIAICATMFYLIYFPFYNVMRSSGFMFNPNRPVESLSELVSSAIDNWSYRDTDNKSEAASEIRSMGLYRTLYWLVQQSPSSRNGKLTIMSIDLAIPKIFNPNKGDGPEEELERMTKAFKDQADSILLHSYGEFHYAGFLYACLLYVFIFFIYNSYSNFYTRIFHSRLVQIYVAFTMLSFVWNVEGGLSGNMSWFFSSISVLIILILIEKNNIIDIKF